MNGSKKSGAPLVRRLYPYVDASQELAEAFAALPSAESETSPPPAVIVRRRRVALGSASDTAAEQTSPPPELHRAPRVFRTAAPTIRASEAPVESQHAEPEPLRRRRVRREEHRPGEVTVQVPDQAPTWQPPAASADPQSLAKAQAALDLTLELASRATGLTFTEDRYAAEWERLAAEADELMLELRHCKPRPPRIC